MRMEDHEKIPSALILVDVQYDFLPGGALAVPEGDDIVPVINSLLEGYTWTCVCATQDYHPPNHVSFAVNHPGREEFQEIPIQWQGEVQQQRLWPKHCIQHTEGCELAKEIRTDLIDKTCQKGYNRDLDSYSGFADSFNAEETGLDQFLRDRKIERVFLVGLAEDYCVYETALAAAKRGYQTFIVREAVRGLNPLSPAQQLSLDENHVSYTNISSTMLESLRN